MTIQHDMAYGTAANRPQGALALEDRFEILKDDIGDGSFGSVSLARVRTAGGHVARRGTTIAIKTMKKTFESFAPCLELREVVFLRTLPHHPHLVPALDIFLDPYSKKLHICMEHMDGNLYQLMKARDHKPLNQDSVKSILCQILSGLEHIHAHHFFHRDVKPENILVSSSSETLTTNAARRPSTLATPPTTPPVYTVKIADFGLARETHSKLPYTTYVSTRWYRAPEVLLRAGQYSAPVDIWAFGAMAVEVATLKPLFPGSNEVDQVWRVCEIMGSPGNWFSRMGGKIGGGDWPEGTKLASQLGFSFPKMAPHSLETILQPAQCWASPLSDLVTWCLMWDPKNRPTSTQALNHPYFDGAIDPLRPKSAASRGILSRKRSDLGYRSPKDGEVSRPLNTKPSWFRRSMVGRDSSTHTVPQVAETKVVTPQATTTTTAPTPASNASSKTKVRPQNEKRFTWANGASTSTAAPMPILPTIRPISPLSDAVTAQASARPSKDSPNDRDEARRRRAELEDKAVRKIGRQLSVASTGNHYADVMRQETERALNGNSGLVSPPSGHKESFFSHLRKRARRLSGRNQLSYLPNSDDLESGAGCGPWSTSNRSSMAVDPPAAILTLESQDSPLEKALQSVRYSNDLSSPSGVGKMRASGSESSIQKSLYASQEHSTHRDADGPAMGPVSSRTRRALQRSSHPVPRYETPDEQEELLDEMVHMANTAALRLGRKPVPESDKALRVPPTKESTPQQRANRQPLRDLEVANPYPTPSPSGKREGDYFNRRESAAQVSPIAIAKPSGHSSNRVTPKWPTPPYEENEWAAAAAASIYAAGAAYR
ncbi:MAG: hypothetical protein M1823_002223 [Watsoniomyces obsoletus]|nr:MAG: hypothetical protein M1823_002223 [Watsoniomyces obsoletus]